MQEKIAPAKKPADKLTSIPKAVTTKPTFSQLPAAARESLAKSEGFPTGSGHLIPGHTEVSKKAIQRVLSDAVAEHESQGGK